MSKTFRNQERNIRVRGIQRGQPDLRRLARVLISLAQAEAEAAAQAEHQGIKTGAEPKPLPSDASTTSSSAASPPQTKKSPTPDSSAAQPSTDGEAA